MAQKDVRAAIAEAAARGECGPDDSFVFHGLRKNACCYLIELGLSDATVGGLLAMSPEMVRHYSRRKRTLMIAQEATEKVVGGKLLGIRGEIAKTT